MPALSVSVDGKELATVANSDVTMLNASLSGQRWDHEPAILRMDGGNYDAQDSQPYRIWINEVPIAPGQLVTVSCVAERPTSHAGKTIAQLFPEEPPCEQTDFTPTTAMLEELRSRPMLRDGYVFKLTTSHGVEYSGHTQPGEYGFTLRVMWTSLHRPECARFSVSTNTVEQMQSRTPGREHVKGELFLGQSLRFQVWPTTPNV